MVRTALNFRANLESNFVICGLLFARCQLTLEMRSVRNIEPCASRRPFELPLALASMRFWLFQVGAVAPTSGRPASFSGNPIFSTHPPSARKILAPYFWLWQKSKPGGRRSPCSWQPLSYALEAQLCETEQHSVCARSAPD
jgi:hypothetical protein